MRKTKILIVLLVISAAVLGLLALRLAHRNSQYRLRLANGDIFELKHIEVISTNYSYSYSSRGRLWEMLSPVLPQALLQKFPANGGGFGFGTDGETNLVIITSLHYAGNSSSSAPHRLRVSDGESVYDAAWGAHTLGMPRETVNGWVVRAFPRRTSELILEFLTLDAKDGWTRTARFTVPNPLAGQFGQWRPGVRVQADGNLTVRLAEFRSGSRVSFRPHKGDSETAALATRMLFTFEEAGRATEQWRVQKLVISDATGNKWSPYLDLTSPGLSWAKGGQVEFFGALWPGEAAWRLDVEATRIAGFAKSNLFQFTVPLPAPGTVTTLTNEWTNAGTTVAFVGLASPNTEHPGDLRWVGKWWGEDKDHVCSLVLKIRPGLKGKRLQLVTATDQHGERVQVIQHQGQDYSSQGIFLNPAESATELTLTFSLTASRFVQFLATPDFVQNPQRTN